jgi:hypothetical protein
MTYLVIYYAPVKALTSQEWPQSYTNQNDDLMRRREGAGRSKDINASEALGENNAVIAIVTGALNFNRDYLRKFWLGADLGKGLYACIEIADNV